LGSGDGEIGGVGPLSDAKPLNKTISCKNRGNLAITRFKRVEGENGYSKGLHEKYFILSKERRKLSTNNKR